MSHLVSVAIKNVATKERLLEFLGAVYRPWFEVLDDGESESEFSAPSSIQDKPTHIGFEYEDRVSPEWAYNYAVIRWIALRAGRRRKQFKQYTLSEPVPYLTHWSDEGSQTIPVILEGTCQSSALRNLVSDQYGIIVNDRTARDLAWYNIPEDIYGRISILHLGEPSSNIREALIRSGVEKAKVILQFIRAEVARLDTLWGGT